MMLGYVDIEIHEKDDDFAQARYLAHGISDVLWTDDLVAAIAFLRKSIEEDLAEDDN